MLGFMHGIWVDSCKTFAWSYARHMFGLMPDLFSVRASKRYGHEDKTDQNSMEFAIDLYGLELALKEPRLINVLTSHISKLGFLTKQQVPGETVMRIGTVFVLSI